MWNKYTTPARPICPQGYILSANHTVDYTVSEAVVSFKRYLRAIGELVCYPPITTMLRRAGLRECKYNWHAFRCWHLYREYRKLNVSTSNYDIRREDVEEY